MKDGKKKTELKNSISFQTPPAAQDCFKVTPVCLSEYRDRAFYMSVDAFPHGCGLAGKGERPILDFPTA